LDVSFAGSEANVAVSLASYGIDVDYITRLPENPIADKCLMELRAHRVTVDHVLRGGERIGILYLETGSVARSSCVYYDRSNSALSTIRPNMIDWRNIFEDATWFHWTGITPALSEAAAAVCLEALQVAKEMGITISCDINYRGSLWKYGQSASQIMPSLVSYCDVIMGNEEDCEKVFNIKPDRLNVNQVDSSIDPELFQSVCSQVMIKFPHCKKVALTIRSAINANHNLWRGVLYSNCTLKVSKQYDITHIVDRVGSGDAFMGSLIYGLINSPADEQGALDFAVAASCLKHTIYGDYNLVSYNEVKKLLEGNLSGRVKR